MTKKRMIVFGAAAAVLVVAAFAVLVVVQKLRDDDVQLATEAPEIDAPPAITGSGATTTPATSGSSGTTAQPAPPAAAAGPLRFLVDSASSKAQYVVKEKLFGVDTTAVGTTTDVTGEIYVSTAGLVSTQKSTFKVDLRTLKTDESRRDVWVRNDTLRTNQFPFAEFTLEKVDGFPASYVDGSEVAMTISGSMTVKGVTKPVTWQVKARRAGDTLTGIADADFKMSEFGLTPPNVGFAVAQDDVHVQVTIVAKQAAG